MPTDTEIVLQRRNRRVETIQHAATANKALHGMRPVRTKAMTEFLLLLVFNELVIMGINIATMDDMVLGKPAIWLEKRLPEWITKPLWTCTYCGSSAWGVLVYWSFVPWTLHNLHWFPFYVLALCGMGTVAAKFMPDQSPAKE